MGNQTADTIVVFTARSPERILSEGGSGDWVINVAHARSCKWLVCTQNQRNPDPGWPDPTQPHGAGFLVGRITGLAASEETPGRWVIEIGEYASINLPSLWAGWRNPVRYTTLNELGIDPENLKFEMVPVPEQLEKPAPSVSMSPQGLTIAQAKEGLAATYGVQPDAIEILIRG